ncbi:Rrf2 family transcriptional regulator [Lactiplantibacillus dongliensis]|uniref:Rrf2 family transcriptional regulator n=1 Tax=Lactiplantibacillus dongliensis TaxID=2559919 RepID=A0ABW1R9L4_9LACO|nr:Rrf2 family transcriptional regulator [Lactiplantibacillus dongliensis]
MKYSTKLSDAIHVLTFIALGGNGNHDLSSTAIAHSLNKNASQVRQLMSQLKRADLLSSTTGHPQPQLTRPTTDISLCNIYEAVDARPLLHLNMDTASDCQVGQAMPIVLDAYYQQVQQAAQQTLKAITLADVMAQVQKVEAQS